MKILAALLFLITPMRVLYAVPPPIGLWEDVIVVDDDTLQLISHQHFIFTNQKLATPTLFTALKNYGGEIDTFCCIEVQNTTSLSASETEKKFSHDHDFVQRFSHIRGLKYIYEARLASREIWNDKMLLLKGSRNDTNDIPFSAPVIAGRLGFSEIAGNHFFGTDGHEIQLTTDVSKKNQKRLLIHRFMIDDQRTIFTVPILGD